MRFSFADFRLDVDRRELCCGLTPVDVEPQVFDLLHYLVQNCDRVVTKDDLIAAVWRGRIVSDSTIASRINAARRALGDSGQTQRLIRTVARKGVRFIGDVRMDAEDQEPASAAGPAPNGSQVPARPASDGPAIGVLPFVNMSGEGERDYFSDGISEDIVTALSRLRWFPVIARHWSLSSKDKSVHLRQIADDLGVGYLVEGSVRKSGDRVRITARLSDVATGSQLWGERYDRCVADAFAVQDEITDAIVAAVEPRLYAAENLRAARKPPGRLAAWDLVMRALSHFWRVTREHNGAAQALLEKAIAIDANCTQAQAVLSVSHAFGIQMGWEDRAVTLPLAERAALCAIQADIDDPWSHLAMAFVYVCLRRIDEALAAFEWALHLNPSFSLAHGYHGLVLCYVGRWQEGAAATRRAQQLSPRDPFSAIFSGAAGVAAFVGGRYDEAMRLAREGIRQRRDFAAAYRVLTAAAAMKGDLDAAKAALSGLRHVQPNISLAWIAAEIPLLREDRVHYLDAFRRASLE